ncbi:hypothetical protein RSAG8_09097, partial [Rhizoctonia solani AG-8 WAC10335]
MLYSGLRRCCTRSFIMGRGLAARSMSEPMKTISLQRNVILSAIARSTDSEPPRRTLPPARPNSDEDVLELTGKPDRKRASLHVANIPPDTTDEEFRQAFSVIPGIVSTELVFNSGTMRDYKNTTNRGFGFLHFESELAATAAMRHLNGSPIRIQGYETEVKPNRSRTKSRNDPSHVLHLSGLPLDLQYLESLRFMAGTPTSRDAAYDFRRLLDTFDCIQRYKLIKDRITDEFRGFTIVNCGSVDNAWMMLEWFNREYPHYRVAFVVSGYEYEQDRKAKLGETRGSGKLRSRPERDYRRDSD